MPVDPVAPAAPSAQRPKAPAKTLNDADFGALVNQDMKANLRPGPKMTPSKDDGFKPTTRDPSFLPLSRNAFTGTDPLNATPVETLGAATKHPLGPQRR